MQNIFGGITQTFVPEGFIVGENIPKNAKKISSSKASPPPPNPKRLKAPTELGELTGKQDIKLLPTLEGHDSDDEDVYEARDNDDADDDARFMVPVDAALQGWKGKRNGEVVRELVDLGITRFGWEEGTGKVIV